MVRVYYMREESIFHKNEKIQYFVYFIILLLWVTMRLVLYYFCVGRRWESIIPMDHIIFVRFARYMRVREIVILSKVCPFFGIRGSWENICFGSDINWMLHLC